MLGAAIGRLLLMPPAINVRHIVVAARHASASAWRTCATPAAPAAAFSFDEAVRGADRMTVAVTLFALLELYKRGEADWDQQESFGEIAVHGAAREPQHAPVALSAGGASRLSAGRGALGGVEEMPHEAEPGVRSR